MAHKFTPFYDKLSTGGSNKKPPIPSNFNGLLLGHNGPLIGGKRVHKLPGYTADTISSSAKYVEKAPIYDDWKAGFDHITKNNPNFPLIPPPLPGRKIPKYDDVQSRFKREKNSTTDGQKEQSSSKSSIKEKVIDTIPDVIIGFNSRIEDEALPVSLAIEGEVVSQSNESVDVINPLPVSAEDSDEVDVPNEGPTIIPFDPTKTEVTVDSEDTEDKNVDPDKVSNVLLLSSTPCTPSATAETPIDDDDALSIMQRIKTKRIEVARLAETTLEKCANSSDEEVITEKYQTIDYSFISAASIIIGNYDAFVDKYEERDQELGHGEYATVVLGSRLVDHQLVAIKKINKTEIDDWGVVDGVNYPLEYLILKKLSRCNGVNKLLDAYETDQEYFLVLELMEEGCNLEEWIRENGAQSETFAKSFFRQLLEAVRECHREGVLHRDLKEGNILIDKNKPSEPKLIDFGYSALLENSPFKECLVTFCFMAPEVYDESKEYDGLSAEVYSLGVILYDLITGSLGLEPIEEEEEDDDDKVVIPDVSIECLKLIDSMLATCPTDRPTIDQIRQHPWLMKQQ